jgi:hypothetical protein
MVDKMEDLNCKSVQALLWDEGEDLALGINGGIADLSVDAHLGGCRECSRDRAEIRSMQTALRSLPKKAISPLLATRLQVIASREHSRQALRRNVKARVADIGSRMKLAFDNLLRPLAVPAAGGILASFFCFSIIVDTLHVHPDWRNDIPVGLYTEVTMAESSPFSFAGDDIIVQLTIDEKGHVSDYTVPDPRATAEDVREIGNLVLYSTFTPAVSFGQRVSSKILVSIHHIDVRG